MDAAKLLELGTKYLGDYVTYLVGTLFRPGAPIAALQPQTPAQPTAPPRIATSDDAPADYRLSTELVVFLLLSIAFGAALEATIPGRAKADLLFAKCVFLLSSWLFYGLLTWAICRLLGGRAGFMETLSITLRYQAVLYFVVGFVALSFAVLMSSPGAADNVYLVLHPLLFAAYLTVAAGRAHGFRWRNLILGSLLMLVALFEVVFIWLARDVLRSLGHWK